MVAYARTNVDIKTTTAGNVLGRVVGQRVKVAESNVLNVRESISTRPCDRAM